MLKRYKQTLILVMLLSIGLLLLVGCGGSSGKSPSETVRAFYMAGNEGKYSDVEKYFSSDALILMKNEWAALTGGIKGSMDAVTRHGNIETVEITEEEVRGEGAAVFYTIHYRNGDSEKDSEELIKEDGVWKITVPSSNALGANVDAFGDDFGFPETAPPATESDSKLNDLNDLIDAVRTRLDKLESDFALFGERVLDRLDSVESSISFTSSPPVKIAYISTDAVSDLRQLAVDKQGEITKLQQQYMASTISKDEYNERSRELQVGLLQAQINIDIGTIDKMLASSGFSDMKSDLQLLKDEARPVVDEMKNLVSTVRVGIVDSIRFDNRYSQLKNAFGQLDELLTQAATAKIVQAANKIAEREGYDIVLRTKNVIVYRNSSKIEDITELVKQEIESYL